SLDVTGGGPCGVQSVTYSATYAPTLSATPVLAIPNTVATDVSHTISIPITGVGITTVTYHATSNGGNGAPPTRPVKTDRLPPADGRMVDAGPQRQRLVQRRRLDPVHGRGRPVRRRSRPHRCGTAPPLDRGRVGDRFGERCGHRRKRGVCYLPGCEDRQDV